MTTTFKSASVGDRVWSITRGWGEITKILNHSSFPIHVKYDSTGYDTFTFDGYLLESYVMRSPFWDEVVIDAPVKPMPGLQVDAKVLVWEDGSRNKYCRHFSHFKNNNIYVFDKGLSSWTTTVTSGWNNWELAE